MIETIGKITKETIGNMTDKISLSVESKNIVMISLYLTDSLPGSQEVVLSGVVKKIKTELSTLTEALEYLESNKEELSKEKKNGGIGVTEYLTLELTIQSKIDTRTMLKLDEVEAKLPETRDQIIDRKVREYVEQFGVPNDQESVIRLFVTKELDQDDLIKSIERQLLIMRAMIAGFDKNKNLFGLSGLTLNPKKLVSSAKKRVTESAETPGDRKSLIPGKEGKLGGGLDRTIAHMFWVGRQLKNDFKSVANLSISPDDITKSRRFGRGLLEKEKDDLTPKEKTQLVVVLGLIDQYAKEGYISGFDDWKLSKSLLSDITRIGVENLDKQLESKEHKMTFVRWVMRFKDKFLKKDAWWSEEQGDSQTPRPPTKTPITPTTSVISTSEDPTLTAIPIPPIKPPVDQQTTQVSSKRKTQPMKTVTTEDVDDGDQENNESNFAVMQEKIKKIYTELNLDENQLSEDDFDEQKTPKSLTDLPKIITIMTESESNKLKDLRKYIEDEDRVGEALKTIGLIVAVPRLIGDSRLSTQVSIFKLMPLTKQYIEDNNKLKELLEKIKN